MVKDKEPYSFKSLKPQESTRFSNYVIYIVLVGFVSVLRNEILTTRFFLVLKKEAIINTHG